jgi:cyclic pyranopterin phosphate synthase
MSMVDVSKKPEVYREATAKGLIRLKAETIKLVKEGKIEKGNPFDAAKIAGVLAAKKTSSLIPLCHPLPLTDVKISMETIGYSWIEVTATVKTKAQTGVEMEALVAVTTALLTIWDMTKQYEKDKKGQYPYTLIQNVHVARKVKGKSG